MIVGASTRDGAASRRIGTNGNGIGLLGELGHVGAGSIHGEGVCGAGGHLRAVLRPLGEVVARGRHCCQGTTRTIVIGSCTRDSTTSRGVGTGIDDIGVVLDIVDETYRTTIIAASIRERNDVRILAPYVICTVIRVYSCRPVAAGNTDTIECRRSSKTRTRQEDCTV